MLLIVVSVVVVVVAVVVVVVVVAVVAVVAVFTVGVDLVNKPVSFSFQHKKLFSSGQSTLQSKRAK